MIKTTGKEWQVEYVLNGDYSYELFDTIEEAIADINNELSFNVPGIQYEQINLWRRCPLNLIFGKARKKTATVRIE